MFIAIVRISIRAIKFDEITVTFQSSKPRRPIIIITEKKQLLIGTMIQINFLKTNHKVATINKKTPKPKTIISLLINVIMSSAIIGIPLLTAEISLGRKAQLTPLAGMKKLTSPSSFWNIIGWVEVLTTIIILGYYLMIMSWVTVYLKEYVTGEAFLYDSNTIQSHFNDLQRDPGTLVAYSAVISAVMAFVAARGLQGGVELVSKIFMLLWDIKGKLLKSIFLKILLNGILI